MTNNITIIPSQVEHVRELSKTMREKDKEEARAMGLDPSKALFWAYKYSVFRRTCLVNSEVAAMWGVCGTPIGNSGQPYLITGIACERVSPIKFARIYRQELEYMKTLFPVLENYVDSSYEGAVRMLQIAGFDVNKREPVLMKPSNKPFYRFRIEGI